MIPGYVVRRGAGAAAVPAPVARPLANAAPRVSWLDQPGAPEPLPRLTAGTQLFRTLI